MRPLDFVKAAGVAFGLLVTNVLVAILVMFVYAYLVNPGHPREFYDEAAKRIAPWCSHIAGTALFFFANYFLTIRRPDRNGFLFGAVATLFYVIIDAATIGFVGIVDAEFLLSMLVKFLAALAGAYVASHRAAGAA